MQPDTSRAMSMYIILNDHKYFICKSKKVDTVNVFISRWRNRLMSLGTLLRNEYEWAAI